MKLKSLKEINRLRSSSEWVTIPGWTIAALSALLNTPKNATKDQKEKAMLDAINNWLEKHCQVV